MKFLKIVLVVIALGSPGFSYAGYMECKSTDVEFEQTIAIGFADSSQNVVLLQQTWNKNGVRGGVAYSNRTYKNFELSDWKLGVYAGKSKRRSVSLSIRASAGKDTYFGTVVDFDRVADTMESFNVTCTYK